jgi:Cu(I)/Ag(I) efflux system membrane fusion protein
LIGNHDFRSLATEGCPVLFRETAEELDEPVSVWTPAITIHNLFFYRPVYRRWAEKYMGVEVENKRIANGDGPKRPSHRSAVIAIGIVCTLAATGFIPSVRNVLRATTANIGKGAGSGAGTQASHPLKYTCPMHPSVVSDRPGTCPICAMSLVRQESAAPESDATAAKNLPGGISLSPAERVLANVATAKVAFHEFSTETVAAAKVSWDERRLTRVSSRIAGRVERLHVDFTGAHVVAGQPLLDIYSPDLVVAQKEYLLALEGAERMKESSLPDSQSMMEGLREAARSRLKLWGVTDAQVAELARTRQPKIILTVFSPVTGVVTERLVTAGQYVNEGAALFSVAPLSSIWVEAELYESEIGRAPLETPAVVTSEAYPGREFRGRVSFVDPVVNPETRTVKVRIDLPNPGDLLKPEMFVRVALKGQKARALAIPEGAVVITGERALAWIETAPGTFEPRNISVGRRGDGFCEALSGLSESESVAASGGFLIDSESQLKAAHTEASMQHAGNGR